MSREDYLFTGPDASVVDRHQRQQMAAEIKKVDADRLLNTPVDDVAAYFAEKYKITVPTLDVDNLVVDQREKQIDVSRDSTRTAIVLLNRNRDFSKVLDAIPGCVRSHSKYKKDLQSSTGTTFQYLFTNRDDPGRELFLTVLAFDVPTPRHNA